MAPPIQPTACSAAGDLSDTDQPLCLFQVGDGTTSVIILAGEMLAAAEPFLERNLHPTTIIR